MFDVARCDLGKVKLQANPVSRDISQTVDKVRYF